MSDDSLHRSLHTIRLSAAWEHPPAGGVDPSLRKFHTPSGLGAGDRVWLVLGEAGALVSLSLNGTALDTSVAPRRWEVAGLLRKGATNRLEVVSEAPPETAAGASLQIEPAR